MMSHLGYWKENGKYFVLNQYGEPVEVSASKIAQLEMIRKDGFKA